MSSSPYVASALLAGGPSLASWAASAEALSSAADADGAAAAAAGRDAPAPGLLPLDSPTHLAAALRWAVAYTNALDGPLGAARARAASAHPADVRAAHDFVHELAVFEREPDAVKTTPETFLRDGFGPAQQFHIVFLEEPRNGAGDGIGASAIADASDGAGAAADASPWADHVPIGMALFHATYSTWAGRTIYVEDVYISPAARRRGVGERLFVVCARAARAAGAARLQWSALDWNAPAVALYEKKLRAERLHEWTLFRLDRAGIDRVSGSALR
jgi:GNAT superfamily N-acetyltransferase